MAPKKKPIEYEEEQFRPVFDYINKDLDLLFILIFLEMYKEGKAEINFAGLFKGNYWDIDDVWDEVTDTNDYYSIPDMVIEQASFILEDARMGKVVGAGIKDTKESLKDLLIEIAKIGPDRAKEEAPAFFGSVEQIGFLENQEMQARHRAAEADPDRMREIMRFGDKSVFFTKEEGYFRKLQTIIIDLPSHIWITVEYDPDGITQIEKDIADYIDQFAADTLVEKLPRYQEKRLYFAQQIENFYRYVSRLNLIGHTVNVPFSILTETGFEAVKILKYLQLKGVIKMRWSDEGSWKVEFARAPITPDTLLGISRAESIATSPSRLKADLSFDYATSNLTIDDNKIHVKGPDQRELLNIILKEPSKEWFFSEISELYDHAEAINEKKFYNAAYQVNLKVAQNTPIKDFLLTTKQTVQINKKYL